MEEFPISGSSHAYALRLAGTAGSFKIRGSSAEVVYRIRFELFEEFCPFGTWKNPASLKHVAL